MYEPTERSEPSAPSVRIINLSVGNAYKIFGNQMSPWARLVDWLSEKYSVLFVISAGNITSDLEVGVRRDTFPTLTSEERRDETLKALLANSSTRRIMSPAESINALTVGAMHADSSAPLIPASRFDLFADAMVSPVSRIGHGYGRSVKPDILMPGGRLLHSVDLISPPATTVLGIVTTAAAPGHLVARPPGTGGSLAETEHCRGTSNATALASRAGAKAYEVIENLREQGGDLPSEFDAVLLKAMLVHGASWGDLSDSLLKQAPSFDHIEHPSVRETKKRDLVSRWLGYGPVDENRVLSCADNRATLLGIGSVGKDQAVEFSAPMPPGLTGVVAWRRMTVTLAWISPTSPAHRKYRKAKLWIDPPKNFETARKNSNNYYTVQRGTVQHEVWEGEQKALAFVDGDVFVCKVNCMEDAAGLTGDVKFALCVSLEVAVDSGISIYQEIKERIAPAVRVTPR